MCKIYCGVNNVAREASKIYIGVNNESRLEQKIYVGVDGVARQIWPKPSEPAECEHNWVFDHVNRYDKDPGQGMWEYEEIWKCTKCDFEELRPHEHRNHYVWVSTPTYNSAGTYYITCNATGCDYDSRDTTDDTDNPDYPYLAHYPADHNWILGDDDIYTCTFCGITIERGSIEWCEINGGHTWVLIDQSSSGSLLYECSDCHTTKTEN